MRDFHAHFDTAQFDRSGPIRGASEPIIARLPNGAMRSFWSIGFKMPNNRAVSGSGAPALAARGPAFEGQSSVGGAAPVESRGAKCERRDAVELIAEAGGDKMP
jgi:hypothetical protein